MRKLKGHESAATMRLSNKNLSLLPPRKYQTEKNSSDRDHFTNAFASMPPSNVADIGDIGDSVKNGTRRASNMLVSP